MQIHELNQRKTINEVDLVGPNSIFNVGKQVFNNPAALVKSSALGAAQQAAQQASATKSADTLTKQGYNVGASVKPTVTTAQQLQTVKASAAVQQQVKNLASQWLKQSAALKSRIIPEAVSHFNPKDINDPKYASIFKAVQDRDAAAAAAKKPVTSGPPGKSMPMQPYQVPGAGTSATPATAQGYQTPAADKAKQDLELEKDLTVWKEQFRQWSDQKLASQGITMDMVRQDKVTNDALNKAMTNVAVAAQSGDPNLENEAVTEYLNLAIAGIQAYVNNSQGSSAARTQTTPTPAGTQSADQQIKQQLDKIGITKAQLEALGSVMAQANKGSTFVKDTGNPVLNALAQMSGMKVQ